MSELYYITTICILPLLLITIVVSSMVSTVYKKYSGTHTVNGLTGYDAARKILDKNGLFDVEIRKISGNLTDNYDPRTKVISLSESVYDSTSISAVGVAAHEVGHAIQYSEDYLPVKIRSALVPVCSLSSKLALPLLLIGILFEVLYASTLSSVLFFLGIACYGVYTLFTLVTLPVEFNASRRATTSLTDLGIINPQDEKGVNEMLRVAGMTYVMSFAMSLLQLLRIIAIFGNNNRRRR